ncbi:MAG: hypothetical protein IKP53_06020 [Candidatus Methanomethylophilaceae archaeon]|nr:hypothetical protein [Candidatus Methanomethylophilaceae archaeon]MBR7005924.1 hypothetical protein [Candidatus Methanomethylophilaceae archaeon]
METILIRYSEIGLKSDPVRRRFEGILKRNIIDMLARDSVEAVVSIANSRLYVETRDIPAAVESLRRVFGISSLSVATICDATMDSIKRTASRISEGLLSPGDTFAVEARRDGDTYGFTSMDLKREAGAAILEANSAKGVRVDLTNPDKTVFIEVRSNKAYVFTSYIECHAGLPLGSQGHVLAYVDDDRGLVSAWLMMKRGCRVTVCGDFGLRLLNRYDPHLRTLGKDEEVPGNILGFVRGCKIDQLLGIGESRLPVFMPTIGMSDGTIAALLNQIESGEARAIDIVCHQRT